MRGPAARLVGIALAAAGLAAAAPASAHRYEVGLAAYERNDFRKSLEILRALGDKGDARAQYLLGRHYQFGQGVKPDRVEAFYWYRRAEAKGHLEAKLFRQLLEMRWKITAQEKARAERKLSALNAPKAPPAQIEAKPARAKEEPRLAKTRVEKPRQPKPTEVASHRESAKPIQGAAERAKAEPHAARKAVAARKRAEPVKPKVVAARTKPAPRAKPKVVTAQARREPPSKPGGETARAKPAPIAKPKVEIARSNPEPKPSTQVAIAKPNEPSKRGGVVAKSDVAKPAPPPEQMTAASRSLARDVVLPSTDGRDRASRAPAESNPRDEDEDDGRGAYSQHAGALPPETQTPIAATPPGPPPAEDPDDYSPSYEDTAPSYAPGPPPYYPPAAIPSWRGSIYYGALPRYRPWTFRGYRVHVQPRWRGSHWRVYRRW